MTRPVELVRQHDGSYAAPKIVGSVLAYLAFMAALGVCIGCALASDLTDTVHKTCPACYAPPPVYSCTTIMVNGKEVRICGVR